MKSETNILTEGLTFPETPRWHDGKLWFSDMVARKVMTVGLEGRVQEIVKVPRMPSGIGWLPDGRLLVVSMADRKLMRLDPEGLVEAADVSSIATFHLNDMVVDQFGRAYIGNFGFDTISGKPFVPAVLALVMPDGTIRVVAADMAFPNGTVITPDGRTLIVAEYKAMRLTAFDIAPDGSLSNRRIWAELHKDELPDGICLDAEGAVWVASPNTGDVLRVSEGGKVSRRIKGGKTPYACMLGGPEGRTLFICETISAEAFKKIPSGRIEIIDVDVPRAGWP